MMLQCHLLRNQRSDRKWSRKSNFSDMLKQNRGEQRQLLSVVRKGVMQWRCVDKFSLGGGFVLLSLTFRPLHTAWRGNLIGSNGQMPRRLEMMGDGHCIDRGLGLLTLSSG